MRVSLLSYAIYFAAAVSEVEVLICNLQCACIISSKQQSQQTDDAIRIRPAI